MVVTESDEKTKVDIDTALVEEIGQFGKYQIITILKLFVPCVFVSWNISEFVFTTARIQTRCLIQECENSSQTEFSPSWITNAVPSSSGSLDSCQRFGNSSVPVILNDTCPASLFDASVLRHCEEYVYESTNTVVYDFDLACDEWRRAMIGSVRIFGMMLALALTGYISDRWGRRLALALNTTCAGVWGVARYWAATYEVYVLILFLESVTCCGVFHCAYVLLVELLRPKYRKVGAALLQTFYTIGQITLGLIAWLTTDWRSLILALYIPQFICVLYFWMGIESVRWLISKGRFKDAEIMLQKAAQANGKKLSQKTLEDFMKNAEVQRKKETEKKPPLVLLVLRNRMILTRCFVTCMWAGTTSFVYYGLSFNAVNLSGNQYLNYAVVSAVEIPGFWMVALIIDKIGRKPTLITAFWLCAVCQVGFIFIPDDFTSLSLAVYMLGKFAISGVAISKNMYALELFPTECRQRLYNFASIMGRVGSVVAPLTPAFATTFFAELPFILFGGMALLTGFLTFLVPETLGSKLPDTMDEALSVNKQDKKTKPI